MNLRLKKLRKVNNRNIYIYSNETKIETVTKIKKKKSMKSKPINLIDLIRSPIKW